AEGRRQPGAGVAGAEHVVLAFRPPQEPAEPARLAQRREAIVAAGEDFPRIALVPDVPDDLVARRVERATQRHRQLDHAEPRPDVPAGLGDDGSNSVPEPTALALLATGWAAIGALKVFRRR